MSTNVQRFIALQTQINNQIDTVGQADIQLAGELDYIGDQLSNDEINQVVEWYNSQHGIIDWSTDPHVVQKEARGKKNRALLRRPRVDSSR